MTKSAVVEISVIIPCYNRVGLLKATLKNVACAIRTVNAEIILVDDGSAEPVAGQISEFTDLPLRIIRQENSGLTTSRYVGLMAARGEYIQFLDSDDQVAATKFSLQLESMKAANADISHTDRSEYQYNPATGLLTLETTRKIRHSAEPAEFFIGIQPAPHSPIFRRDYLVRHLAQPFIPLSRDYDSIGEVWFYYNLSIYPARIIKIDEPLTWIIHHQDGRLTDNWEIMGMCALALQHQFAVNLPQNINPPPMARLKVATAAFNTFKRLPYDIDPAFQRAFIDVWKMLGKTPLAALNGGSRFSFLAKMIGPVNAARVFKRLKPLRYNNARSISDEELHRRLEAVLTQFKPQKK